MRSLTKYSTGPAVSSSSPSQRNADPMDPSEPTEAAGPADPTCEQLLSVDSVLSADPEATSLAKPATASSQSMSGMSSPSASSSDASLAVWIPVIGSTEMTLTLSSGTGRVKRSYSSCEIDRSSLIST